MKAAAFQNHAPRGRTAGQGAFTLVEIAISMAIIGFALVAIIGALPRGMNVQRENREETIITQDAAYLMEAIRSGARGLDSLTNAVQEIYVYAAEYDANSNRLALDTRHYTYTNATLGFPLTNGFQIIGLLGTPKYVPATFGGRPGFYSNHIVASVHALNGLAAEKYPQNNPDVRQDAFGYRLITENLLLPVPEDFNTNSPSRQLSGNLREVRLLFRWPLFPGGKIGNGFQTFRTTVTGLLTNEPSGSTTWFFQPQTFVKAP